MALLLCIGVIAVELRSSLANSSGGSKELATTPTTPPTTPPVTAQELTEVADADTGSSDPTYYATHRRLVVSRGGRTYLLYGRHATGIQLAWRDAAGGDWRTLTRGDVPNGLVLGGTGSGDRSASIATVTDATGEEHAWIVLSGGRASATEVRPVELRRLTELDAPFGPRVGPPVLVEAAALTESRADLAFETTPEGPQGTIVWTRRTAEESWDLVVATFTDVSTDTPSISDVTVITSGSVSPAGTLTASDDGVRLLVRTPARRLQVYRADRTTSPPTWRGGPLGVEVSSESFPSAIALDSGDLVSAVETDTLNHVVTVQRFNAAGTSAVVEFTTPPGYQHPSLTTDGVSAWLIMVRSSDGFIVSRQLREGLGWDTADRVEIGPEGGGNHAWPSVPQLTTDRLHILVRGTVGRSDVQSAVLSYERQL